MKMRRTALKIVMVVLVAKLVLPNPAWGLRDSIEDETPGGLAAAFGITAAGLEENRPLAINRKAIPVRTAAFSFENPAEIQAVDQKLGEAARLFSEIGWFDRHPESFQHTTEISAHGKRSGIGGLASSDRPGELWVRTEGLPVLEVVNTLAHEDRHNAIYAGARWARIVEHEGAIPTRFDHRWCPDVRPSARDLLNELDAYVFSLPISLQIWEAKLLPETPLAVEELFMLLFRAEEAIRLLEESREKVLNEDGATWLEELKPLWARRREAVETRWDWDSVMASLAGSQEEAVRAIWYFHVGELWKARPNEQTAYEALLIQTLAKERNPVFLQEEVGKQLSLLEMPVKLQELVEARYLSLTDKGVEHLSADASLIDQLKDTAGLEEVGQIVTSPEVQAGLKAAGWASLGEGRYVVNPARLQGSIGRLTLHAGLEEPDGVPENAMVRMEAGSASEMIAFYREHQLGRNDVVLVNMKLVTPTEVLASLPLSTPFAVLGSTPQERLALGTLLFLAELSRNIGPILHADIRPFTAEDGRSYVLVDIQA